MTRAERKFKADKATQDYIRKNLTMSELPGSVRSIAFRHFFHVGDTKAMLENDFNITRRMALDAHGNNKALNLWFQEAAMRFFSHKETEQ